MPDIRYVCLSDLHFGEEDSLLTNLKQGSTDTDPTQASPVMKQLVECMEYLISMNEDQKQKPTLILNGDILELALATTNEATMAFERFVELIMPEGKEPLFDKQIIYLPGNHDHHLWEIGREVQYVDYLSRTKPGKYQKIPWHTSRMFDPAPDTYLLTWLIRRFKHLKNVTVTAAYPNYGLLSRDGQKCVIFHHGHLMESMYQLMSTLRTLIFPDREMPRHVWDIEAENFAWIDFFWSTMGRSGEIGQDIELIYEKMHDREQFKKVLSGLATGLAKRFNLPGWGDRMEAGILNLLFAAMVDKVTGQERHQPGNVLSESGRKGLQAYMEGPLREHILTECGRNMPSDVTFVFGHTHKPFQEDMNFKQYPQWVNVYNTGGWIVDTPQPQRLHGGVIILVDEALNTTSVHMYHESANPAEYSVSVEAATHSGEMVNSLHQRILGLIRPSEDPWETFSALVAREARVRAENLQERIKK